MVPGEPTQVPTVPYPILFMLLSFVNLDTSPTPSSKPTTDEPAHSEPAAAAPAAATPEAQTPAAATPPTNPTAYEHMRTLHPSAKSVWMIKYALFTAVVVLAIGAYEITQLFSTADRMLPVGTYTGTVLTVGALITIGIPLLRYKYWRFTLMDEELFLERGIFNRVRTVVPLRRIQHLDVSQDVLEREFDLGKLIVHTAGTRSADVVVPGLAYAEAEQFRDDLRNYITEDAL